MICARNQQKNQQVRELWKFLLYLSVGLNSLSSHL